jgi:hypothetical protein
MASSGDADVDSSGGDDVASVIHDVAAVAAGAQSSAIHAMQEQLGKAKPKASPGANNQAAAQPAQLGVVLESPLCQPGYFYHDYFVVICVLPRCKSVPWTWSRSCSRRSMMWLG